MRSSTNEIQASAAPTVTQRHRSRVAAVRTALLLLATILVNWAALNAATLTAQELPDTTRTPSFKSAASEPSVNQF